MRDRCTGLSGISIAILVLKSETSVSVKCIVFVSCIISYCDRFITSCKRCNNGSTTSCSRGGCISDSTAQRNEILNSNEYSRLCGIPVDIFDSHRYRSCSMRFSLNQTITIYTYNTCITTRSTYPITRIFYLIKEAWQRCHTQLFCRTTSCSRDIQRRCTFVEANTQVGTCFVR
jgi:hypothetical protein